MKFLRLLNFGQTLFSLAILRILQFSKTFYSFLPSFFDLRWEKDHREEIFAHRNCPLRQVFWIVVLWAQSPTRQSHFFSPTVSNRHPLPIKLDNPREWGDERVFSNLLILNPKFWNVIFRTSASTAKISIWYFNTVEGHTFENGVWILRFWGFLHIWHKPCIPYSRENFANHYLSWKVLREDLKNLWVLRNWQFEKWWLSYTPKLWLHFSKDINFEKKHKKYFVRSFQRVLCYFHSLCTWSWGIVIILVTFQLVWNNVNCRIDW